MHPVAEIFNQKFNESPQVLVNAPGRINLIGEHTDYNGGLVMPAAIHLSIQFALSKTKEGFSSIYSEALNETLTLHHNLIALSEIKWQNYFIGVVDLLQKDLKQELPHFKLAFSGNIPLGAGLSSSAALTCGFISGLNTLFDLKLDQWGIAKIAQQCEHQYIGVNCGIMDQFAILFGERDSALQLNCATLEFKPIQFDLDDYEILLCNSMVSHNLAESAYNERRASCESALKLLNQGGKAFKNLSEASLNDLYLLEHNQEMYSCVKHVLTENEHVLSLSKALQNKNIAKAGLILNASHESLRNEYKVTCQESDFLFEEINKIEGVTGCRQMGGGFGGCMLILTRKSNQLLLKKQISNVYEQKYNILPEFYAVNLSEGVKVLKID